jgi:REP element-mobilizing transposase RayT
MRAPYTELYVHLVWSTWDRLALITPATKPRLTATIVAKCQELDADVIAVELMPEHAHLLIRLPPSVAVAGLVKEVKGASSHLVNRVLGPDPVFKWQGGYGAFTVAKEGVPAVKAYIANQLRHHSGGKLIDEWEVTSATSPGE